MNYNAIKEKIKYWINYEGQGDVYRKIHDLDCILTGGNLLADTIISLWLPLRYTLNYFNLPRWIYWKEYESISLKPKKLGLKNHREFLIELVNNIEMFLPQDERTEKLIRLFELGQTRANIMILPIRSWNAERGMAPYYDYLPHFLYDQMSDDKIGMMAEWIVREKLTMFFENETDIKKENLRDLAGTGDVRCHAPKDINLVALLDNYINVLESRENALKSLL